MRCSKQGAETWQRSAGATRPRHQAPLPPRGPSIALRGLWPPAWEGLCVGSKQISAARTSCEVCIFDFLSLPTQSVLVGLTQWSIVPLAHQDVGGTGAGEGAWRLFRHKPKWLSEGGIWTQCALVMGGEEHNSPPAQAGQPTSVGCSKQLYPSSRPQQHLVPCEFSGHSVEAVGRAKKDSG